MKTVIPTIPTRSQWAQSEEPLNWSQVKKLDLETDTSYAIKIVTRNGYTFNGSIKTLTEQSVNTAGTRRFLLKVELPLAPVNPEEENKCCCTTGAEAGDMPTVSAHVVITVPKSIALGITKSDAQAKAQVSATTRILQSVLSSIMANEWDGSMDTTPGTIIGDNVIIVKADGAEAFIGHSVLPVQYNQAGDDVRVAVDVPDSAPLWGLIGGLRNLA